MDKTDNPHKDAPDLPASPEQASGLAFRQRVTSRKFIAYVAGMVIATVYLFSRPDAFDTWTTFALWLTAIYVGANVAYKGAEIGKQYVQRR